MDRTISFSFHFHNPSVLTTSVLFAAYASFLFAASRRQEGRTRGLRVPMLAAVGILYFLAVARDVAVANGAGASIGSLLSTIGDIMFGVHLCLVMLMGFPGILEGRTAVRGVADKVSS